MILSLESQKSVNRKIWQQRLTDENNVLALCRAVRISDFLARILLPRLEDLSQATDFLVPKLKNLLPNPFHLLDMQKAVDRTVQAIINKQKICIFADYDVDGATSSSLLKNVFRDLEKEVDVYIPDRIDEGYGPTPAAIQKIKDNATDLLITVDCGVMAHEALTYASQIKLDVIVIDHHTSGDILPEAVAIVNPNRIDEISRYKYLAAVGVSFLFLTALLCDLKKLNFFKDKNLYPNLMQYLDLVALGTVCDVMKIIHLNRAFVTQGLKVLQQRKNLGIKTLCDGAALNEQLDCYHLGFVLGPRINAGGRVGKASLGASLLSTRCAIEANLLAKKLEKHNNERKIIELIMIEEATQIALTQKNNSVLFIVGKKWHQGVIGIVASRLKEKFNKPVSVIALNNGIGKASCRSIKNIDFSSKIINAKSQNLIMAGGGHAMAAGFTVLEEKLQELQEFLNHAFQIEISKQSNLIYEEYDLELTINSVNLLLMQELNKLEPFGQGNPEPIFKLSNLFILKADVVSGKHIRCLLTSSKGSLSSKTLAAIAFNSISSPIEDTLLSVKSRSISVIGSLKMNIWKGSCAIQLRIIDLII